MNATARQQSKDNGTADVVDLDAFRARVQARDVMTVRELAEYLSLSRNTTYEYLNNGTIPGTRIGRRWVISRRRITAWLDATSTGGA